MHALRFRPGIDALLLLAFALFTATALVGYGTFGLHPEWLTEVPGAQALYAQSYRIFSQGQVWFAFAIFALFLTRSLGARWLLPFALVYALSLGSELLGTNYGIPFGAYSYTDLLGYKIGGHVPLAIPVSWFYMAVPAFLLAHRAAGPAPSPGRSLGIAALGALLLSLWDLALDPAMSYLTPFWVWEDTGPYYNMPWLNLVGWYVTSFVLMIALGALGVGRWRDSLNQRWLLAYYGLNIAMPIGMCAAAGSWLAVGVTSVTLLGALTIVYRPRALALAHP